jgi:hypothetical protein
VWTKGQLAAKKPQGISIKVDLAHRRLLRSEIRRILMEHHHGQWNGVKEVAIGASAGGLIGGLAFPTHRALAAIAFAAVGAVKGLMLAVMGMFLKEGNLPWQDEILVYHTDR